MIQIPVAVIGAFFVATTIMTLADERLLGRAGKDTDKGFFDNWIDCDVHLGLEVHYVGCLYAMVRSGR